MKPAITVTLPINAVSVLNTREHWSARAKRAKVHRAMVRNALLWQGRTAPPWPVAVTLTRIAPRELDGDNAQGALKAVRDGVADWLGIDDGDARIRWEYRQERGGTREYAVRVEVAEGVPECRSLEDIADRCGGRLTQ